MVSYSSLLNRTNEILIETHGFRVRSRQLRGALQAIAEAINEEMQPQENKEHFGSTKKEHNMKLSEIAQMVCDPENQPHQYIGDFEGFSKLLGDEFT